jgi:two-component system, OmpR family, KDP operon response regulator KdpE
LPRVLVIDDDRDLLNVCDVALRAFGHDVWTAATGNDGLTEAAIHAPDVIVLDLGLPDMDGMEVCKRIRTWSAVPIVVLSADGSEDRKVSALDDGADDYMTKPFGMRELNARLRVALRHSKADDDERAELDVGALHLDVVHYEATLDGRPLDLTPREFDFLAYLARNAGKVCTRRMILENVWGSQYANDLNYLKVYAYRIRRKLGDESGRFLQSDPSVGYRLMPPARGSLRGLTSGIVTSGQPGTGSDGSGSWRSRPPSPGTRHCPSPP